MILIALGANLPSSYGEPEETLKASIERIAREGIEILARSSVWLTAPVPVSDQPWYRNAVVSVKTEYSAVELMALLHDIEEEFGRVRGEKNAPRLLDLDIIAYNDEIYDQDGLQIPHPRMHQRAFVLNPLEEIAPRWKHPVLGRFLEDLIADLPADQEAKRAA
ncbi:MAG: 2-amino-4-hydroxy-6-hydroxymethyldihydropteridine diphosphokinase [Pseudomonadota bacterium]